MYKPWPMYNKFISCDWGTSSFRLRLVELMDIPSGLRITGELRNDQGIASTFELWKSTGKSEEHRLPFYRSILKNGVENLEKLLNVSLQDIPLVISGMASSSIGMKELPYKELPFRLDGMDLNREVLEATEEYKHRTLLISGARTTDDVMRGEETQLIGCVPVPAQGSPSAEDTRIFIFPGTHSKHVTVQNGKATDLKTYMTGEYFSLLSKNSILSASVGGIPPAPVTSPAAVTSSMAVTPFVAVTSGSAANEENENGLVKNFREGVRDSVHTNLLHQSFLVRTNQLFGRKAKEENYYYLSGLLIGAECKELINAGVPLTVVSEGVLIQHYNIALKELGITNVEMKPLDQAVLRGQSKILRLLRIFIK